MPEPWQVLFDQIPGSWRSSPPAQAQALILASRCKVEWFSKIRDWTDASEIKAFVQALPTELIQRVILAIRHGRNPEMKSLAQSLLAALPAGQSGPLQPTPNSEVSPPEDDDDELDIDLEELLRN
jgi:hypothetical protein